MPDPSPSPTIGANKAIAAGAAGAGSILVVWLLGQFGISIPPEVASAGTTLITTLLAWLVPHGGSPSTS